MAYQPHPPSSRWGRRLATLGAFVALWGAEPTAASASSQLCEGGTHLLFPRDGGTTDTSSALVFADRVCVVPQWADPADPIVMIAVEDLVVDVDDEPAALVPLAAPEAGWLWRIEPAPIAGSTVTISGCDAAEREQGLCAGAATETMVEGPLLQWTFTVEGEAEPVALTEPVIRNLRATGSTDPFSGEVRTLWSFTLERGETDPGTPMLVDITMNPGPAGTQLPWTTPDVPSEELVLTAPEGEDVCIEARTFDLYGNEGPTTTACVDGGGGGCGCTSGGGSTSAMVLALLLLGLRRRRSRERLPRPQPQGTRR